MKARSGQHGTSFVTKFRSFGEGNHISSIREFGARLPLFNGNDQAMLLTTGAGITMRRDCSSTPILPDELEAAIREMLSHLAQVDQRYRHQRAALEQRSISQGQRKRLRQTLEDAHMRDRMPLVLSLADLHYRMMRATIFGSLANPVPSIAALRGFVAGRIGACAY